MPEKLGQAVARERLRARLVDLRRARGLSSETVTHRTHWSRSKLNRIETGAVTVQAVDVQALLAMYGVRDPDEIAELVDLALLSRRRQWWSGFQLDPEYRDFVAYESEASRITVYQALVVPSLLQTRRYATAVMSTMVGKPEDVNAQNLIDVRMRRQSELFVRMQKKDAPELVALLDGAVLERPIGGADVMREQLDHLLEVAAHEHVRLVVVPLSYGVNPGVGGVFELLEFSGVGDPDVLFIESAIKDATVKDGEVTAAFHNIVEAILGFGLTRDAATTEIHRIRDRL